MPRQIDPSLIPEFPDLSFERALWRAGLSAIGGIDEAGRGCLAGPVTAAVVILPRRDGIEKVLEGTQDSKQLSPHQREALRIIVEDSASAWSIGWSSHSEIDQLGILPATRLAMWRAVDGLSLPAEYLLVDYLELPDIPLPQTRLVKGDARSLSIAAASILAKTHRDDWMIENGQRYPGYGFGQNKGYGTAQHRQAILKLGPCPLHRRSFAPVRDLC
ncbi:MAG: ribonuclease HII [Anaerolineales bacterium]|jgi:ribonuclease HII